MDYIAAQVLWIFLSLWVFRRTIFRLVEGWSYSESALLLGCILGFVCVVGTLNDITYKRNRSGIFVNLLLAYGLYTSIVYFFAYEKYIFVLGLITSVVTMLCLLAIFLKNSNNNRTMLKKKLKVAIYACRRNFGVCMLVVMLFVGGRNLFFGSVASASMEVVNAYGEEYGLKNNIETISKIREEEWQQLSLQEKVDVAQAVAYCEGNYLGLPDKLTVEVGDLEERTLGIYNDTTYRIMIDTEHMLNDSGEEVLRTILHEAYHCYQRRCVEIYCKLEPEERNLLMFYRTSFYVDEVENYVSGSEDEEAYYLQKIEEDARAYSISQAQGYYRCIDEELGGKE